MSEDEFYEDRLRELLTKDYSMKPHDIVQKVHEDFTDFLEYRNL